MLDVSLLVTEATHRAHRAICTDQDQCSGPSEVEMMITAFVLESTMPQILAGITQEFRQALHAMGSGHMVAGDHDALDQDPEKMLAEWFHWYEANMYRVLGVPHDLYGRTGAYLTARAVQDGKTIRSGRDL